MLLIFLYITYYVYIYIFIDGYQNLGTIVFYIFIFPLILSTCGKIMTIIMIDIFKSHTIVGLHSNSVVIRILHNPLSNPCISTSRKQIFVTFQSNWHYFKLFNSGREHIHTYIGIIKLLTPNDTYKCTHTHIHTHTHTHTLLNSWAPCPYNPELLVPTIL